MTTSMRETWHGAVRYADHEQAKLVLESRMMRKYQVRFGGGRMEKYLTKPRQLASRLPYKGPDG